MKEDAADERAVSLDARPSPTGRVIAVVGTEPAELDGRKTVALDVLTVYVAFNRDEPEAARAVSPDLDEGGSEKVNRIPIPQVHLDDLPTTDCPWCHSPNVAKAPRVRSPLATAGAIRTEGLCRPSLTVIDARGPAVPITPVNRGVNRERTRRLGWSNALAAGLSRRAR